MVVRLGNLHASLEQISAFVTEAVAMLRRGTAVPGRLSYDPANDLRLALPASPGYERRKCGFRRMRTVIPIDCGQRFRSIADSVPVIADSSSHRQI